MSLAVPSARRRPAPARRAVPRTVAIPHLRQRRTGVHPRPE
ncbi:MAG TPA: hypothetical protein VF486_13050 [Actinomycetes bacterium]